MLTPDKDYAQLVRNNVFMFRPRHGGGYEKLGVMTLKGKVIVDAKYEKVEIRDNGIAVVTGITGKTQTINLLKVKG